MCFTNLFKAVLSALCSLTVVAAASPGFGQQYSAQNSYRAPQSAQQNQNVNQPPMQRAPQRVAQAPGGPSGASGTVSRHYVPRHLRTASNQSAVPQSVIYQSPGQTQPNVSSTATSNGAMPGQGSYIDPGYSGGEVIGGHMYEGGYDNGYDGGYYDGEYIDDGYGGDYGGDCGYGCPPANDCRDCQIDEDCWATGLGALLYNAEYFAGASGFTSPGTIRVNDGLQGNCSFGLYSGFNVGLPLRKLTCGLVSGQFGIRSVQSNFNGNPVSSDRREQTFVTAGLFRRVDNGLQFGVVADVLHEEWYSQLDMVQVRGDLSWAFGGGSQLGFRFAQGVQDNSDLNIPTFGDINGSPFDTHRIYYQHACPWGGYNLFHVGRSDAGHTVVGVDYDLPLNYKWALQSNFTYLIPKNSNSDGFGNVDEGWNVSVGVVWRPRARNWYRWYHRPMLPVADNGSMIIRRDTIAN